MRDWASDWTNRSRRNPETILPEDKKTGKPIDFLPHYLCAVHLSQRDSEKLLTGCPRHQTRWYRNPPVEGPSARNQSADRQTEWLPTQRRNWERTGFPRKTSLRKGRARRRVQK